jgi:hypothetical protein
MRRPGVTIALLLGMATAVHAADRITPTCDPNRVPSCWVEHGACVTRHGHQLWRGGRTVAAADGCASARLFLGATTASVAAERVPAPAAAAARLSLRATATGPGRDAQHRGYLPDAKASSGDAAIAAARLSAVVLA